VSFVGSTGLLNSDFSFAFSNTDTPAVGTGPTDNPLIQNIRFTDSNVDISGNQTLGTFTVLSAVQSSMLASFDGQSAKNDPLSTADDTVIGNIGSVAVPTATPIPAALPLFGSGLGVMALLLRRKNRKARAAQ
jgi:hypothetical protein